MSLSRRHIFAAGAALAAGAITSRQAQAAKSLDLDKLVADALETTGQLRLDAGHYITQGLNLNRSLSIVGVPGQTIILCSGTDPIIQADGVPSLHLSGLTFDGQALPGDLLQLSNIENLSVQSCRFTNSHKVALSLTACAGHVQNSSFDHCGQSGIFAQDSKGLDLSHNQISDMGNNGIQVWTSDKRDGGARVSNNLISRVDAKSGGTGENGNGISIFRAGNIIIANNRIVACDYSGIRNNGGANVQITGNNISRAGEVAIYAEFGFDGVVITSNIIEDSVCGISITNFDAGGRLAVCNNNLVRNINGGVKSYGPRVGCGIHAEADTMISGNVIENARDFGISLGYGEKTRNVVAQSNIVRDCGRGLVASIVAGAGPNYAINNVVSGSKTAGITGYAFDEPKTDDLAEAGSIVPPAIQLIGNIVTK